MQNSIIKSKLYWFYLAGFFLILALPLLNLPPLFTPPAWSKAIVFRSVLSILFFIFLIKQKLGFQKIKKALNPKTKTFLPFVSLFAFLIATFISTIFSLDVSNSLWGSPERGAGFVNFFFIVLFCVFAFLIIKKESWRKLLDFSLIIGFLTCLIAVFQKFGIFSNIFVFMGNTPSSTMGNPIILSLYILPLLFLALSFFILENPPAGEKVKKYFYLFLTIFFAFSVIFINNERAAFLGVLVGLFWFLVAYPKKIKILKISAILLPIIFLASLFFLSAYPQIYEKWPTLLKNPVSRITTLAKGLGADPSRISVWKISAPAFLEKPFLGYGPENFYVAFNKYYDPTLPVMSEAKNFDRAHNSLIQILIDSGIFALIFYLVFFVSLFWGLQKIKRTFPVSHGLQAGFLAYFVASLASIDGFSNVLIFFFLSAYSLHLIWSNHAPVAPKPEQKSTKWLLRLKIPALWLLGLCIIIFIWQYNLVPLGINEKVNITKSLGIAGGWQEASQILEKEFQTKTFFSSYVNSSYISSLVDRSMQYPEETISLSEKIAEVAENNIKLQPYNARNWLRLGESLTILAKAQNNVELFKKAEDALNKAVELSPNDPEILARLASVIAQNPDYLKLKEIYEKLAKIKPLEVSYKTSLLVVYKELKEYDKAEELSAEIIKTNPELRTQIENFLNSF